MHHDCLDQHGRNGDDHVLGKSSPEGDLEQGAGKQGERGEEAPTSFRG